MRRSALLALLLLLAACAPPQPSGTNTPVQATIYSGDASVPMMLGDQPHPTVATIAAQPDVVWTTLKRVYLALGIPVTAENLASHQIGNANFYKSREMAGSPMSDFMDCGSSQVGKRANDYRIYMSLLTTVEGDGKGGTRVETTFVPAAQNVAEGSADRIPCGTSGRLEQLVIDNIKANLPH